MMPRIYLDNAATSWPKPEGVYRAVDSYLRHNGATAGRGVYREAVEADQLVESARAKVARLINAPDPSRIVFGLNATDALNLALHGLLKPGDRVVTTEVEHNSILRPLAQLAKTRGIKIVRIPCDDTGLVDSEALAASLRDGPQLLAISEVSNVTGVVQDMESIAIIAQRAGVRLLVDAAQSAGRCNIDVQVDGYDLLAASGHKGLLGPLGTGFLYVAPGLESELETIRQGGTGTKSDKDIQPMTMPDRYESGNANVPGLAGLSAGVDYLLSEGQEKIDLREWQLIQQLMQGLVDLPGIRLYGPGVGKPRGALLAFTVEGYDPRELAALLDANFGIQIRAGLHCAPLIHKRLAAWPTGTARISVGPFTTDDDIDQAIAAIREVAGT